MGQDKHGAVQGVGQDRGGEAVAGRRGVRYPDRTGRGEQALERGGGRGLLQDSVELFVHLFDNLSFLTRLRPAQHEEAWFGQPGL
jgi:hypothetical protein